MKTVTFTNRYDETITVKVGDTVCFKSDIEQYGTVTKIAPGRQRGAYTFTLENKNGFDGDYIGGQTITTEQSDYISLN